MALQKKNMMDRQLITLLIKYAVEVFWFTKVVRLCGFGNCVANCIVNEVSFSSSDASLFILVKLLVKTNIS